MLAAPDARPCACACGMPITLGRCGGGSFVCVKLESGSVDAGVDVSRSVYEMNERRFDGFFGDGGACDARPPLVVVGVAAVGDAGSVCSGCSWCVAVVGDESSECTEKYADVGVEMVGAGACGGELVCTSGRVGGEELPGAGCAACADCAGSETVKLGLGEGSVMMVLLRFERPFGLGLRLLIWEIGDVKPLLGPNESGGRESKGIGATTAMVSMPSLSSMSDVVRISAALSSTDGTDWSSCSVNFPRGMRCGSVVWLRSGGDGVMGSISRSKMADDEECLQQNMSGGKGSFAANVH